MYVLNLVPVTSVSITGYVSGTQIAAGQSMILTCTALGGNPTPAVKWFRDNSEIDITVESSSESSEVNEYSFITSGGDNEITYRCEASNTVSTPLTNEITLNVEGISQLFNRILLVLIFLSYYVLIYLWWL